MKQETLEEASWKHNPLKKLDGEFLRHAFKEGAKWQAERMYSEEEFAIEFAEWINRVSYRSFDGNWYLTQIDKDIKKTTKELLEIYKEEIKWKNT
jgi:hypothetical protein